MKVTTTQEYRPLGSVHQINDLVGRGLVVLSIMTKSRERMAYGDFAALIDLAPDGWQPWHRQQIGTILDLMKVTCDAAGTTLAFELLYEKATGKTGANNHMSRLVHV
jgi:hypothetical protein